MSMDFRAFLKDHIVLLDGGMGTLLQARGLRPGEAPERWSISRPEDITAVHRAYYDAGSHVVLTNTFGVSPLKYPPEQVRAMVRAAVACARQAAEQSTGGQARFVALDIGPSGMLLQPYGALPFEEAVSAFRAVAAAGAEAGVDLIMIETMNDSYETKAALLGVKEACGLPVLVSNAYGADGKLMTGASPEAMVALLEGMGADAVGVNCSLGPEALAPVVERYLACASVPVLFKPNAGLPRDEGGRTVYDVDPASFSRSVAALAAKGVHLAGGCCGTTPDYIAALRQALDGLPVPRETEKQRTVISSYTHAVAFGGAPVLIGERINPTGKKRFRQAILDGDTGYIVSEGLAQQDCGAHVLDVNVGVPGIDEAATLVTAVKELQAVIDLPLQLDTSDPAAMAAAMRCYNGKPLVNSVSGKQESMDAVFPLVKRYGGAVIALTLDENGIPETAEGRLAIARRIVREAERYGIPRRELIFDTLTMTVSADPQAPSVTLDAMEMIRRELGCATSLGVSNVSFGLPGRELIGSVFFAAALERGLNAAIMNPKSGMMTGVYRSWMALHGLDPQCADYIAFAQDWQPGARGTQAAAPAEEAAAGLRHAVRRGLKAEAAREAERRIAAGEDPLALVRDDIIPALDEVGRGFEAKTVFLPQLLMSAEAAESAFVRIREAARASAEPQPARGLVVLATVQGDIHDIGKNIVRLLLENYGFQVTDLGRDVPPEHIAEAVVRLRAPLLGLSALMTTTVPAMEATIRLIRREAPWCRVMVGGAVLTEAYAARIGADRYVPDAMADVRYAEEICGGADVG